MLNFAIVNNATIARQAVHVLAECALRSKSYFQNVLFAKLCQKMIEFEEELEQAEREKISDFVVHPHKSKNIQKIVNKSLHGSWINDFNQSSEVKQGESMETKRTHSLIANC